MAVNSIFFYSQRCPNLDNGHLSYHINTFHFHLSPGLLKLILIAFLLLLFVPPQSVIYKIANMSFSKYVIKSFSAETFQYLSSLVKVG